MKKGDSVYIDSKYKKFLNKKNHKFCKSYPNLIDVGLRIKDLENGMYILWDRNGLELRIESFCVKKVFKLSKKVYNDFFDVNMDGYLSFKITKSVEEVVRRMGEEADKRAIRMLIDETT